MSDGKVADSEAVDRDLQEPLQDANQAGLEDAIPEQVIKALEVPVNWPRTFHDAAGARGSSDFIWLPDDIDGRTPLTHAALADSKKASSLEKSTDIHAVNKGRRNSLQNMTGSYSEVDIKPLLGKDADFNATGKDGQASLYIATGSHNGADIEAANKDGQKSPLEYSGSIVWEGLKTYNKCDGAISDILTISGLNCSQSHCYIARSVLEFLTEYYPTFGLHGLNWITRICKRCQGLETITGLYDSVSTRSDISKEVIVAGAAYVILKGLLHAGTLTWTISTNSEELALDVKSALTWTLSALQSQPEDAVGLFSWTPVSLDVELPDRAIFKPPRAESYCWTNLFSYAYIALLPSLSFKDRPVTEGLEIDFSLLLELAAVDREIITEDGLILFGFDTALIPLEPPESRRWHFLVTEGIQITPARVEKEFGKWSKNKKTRDIRFKGNVGPEYHNGNVYVGWCAAPIVKIDTNDLDTTPLDHHISMPSGVCNMRNLEESVKRSSGNDVSSFSRMDVFGSMTGASNGGKGDKRVQQVNVVTKSIQKRNSEGIPGSAQRIGFETNPDINGRLS